jgi:hypothetical protein
VRTGERCDEENALLAAILADATNLGLGRMAAASHGVTRDKLVWTDAYIRPETYKAALARIIDALHALPIATIWGDGRTSSSDRQLRVCPVATFSIGTTPRPGPRSPPSRSRRGG